MNICLSESLNYGWIIFVTDGIWPLAILLFLVVGARMKVPHSQLWCHNSHHQRRRKIVRWGVVCDATTPNNNNNGVAREEKQQWWRCLGGLPIRLKKFGSTRRRRRKVLRAWNRNDERFRRVSSIQRRVSLF